MTSEGPVDNYLSAEEESYFKTGGKNEERIGYDESGEPDGSKTPADSEGISDDDTGATDEPANVEPSEESDDTSPVSDEPETDEDTETSSETKRDYEKAFKTERHKRRELKEALDVQARKTAQMEATLEGLKQSMLKPSETPPQAALKPAEVVPDGEVDPIGYQQYEINQLKNSLKQQQDYLTSQQQSTQRNLAEQAFIQTYKQSAAQFAQSTPDFNDAYNYIVEARTKEFVAAGYTKAEADRLVIEDEMAIASRAFQDKVNPAERVYNLAKARGYTEQKAPVKATPKSLDDVKRGIANSKSLKSGGGEVGDKEAGIADVDAMNFKEFDDFWAGYKAKSKSQR